MQLPWPSSSARKWTTRHLAMNLWLSMGSTDMKTHCGTEPTPVA